MAPSVGDVMENPRLTDGQRRFLATFGRSPLRRQFYLTGGAGLSSAYLAHRASDDLDFFSPEPFKIGRLISFMKGLPGLSELQWLLPKDRTTFMLTFEGGDQVKVEYRAFPFDPLVAPSAVGAFYVDSMVDLVANKLYALIERRYELDRIDIYLMLQRLPDLSFDQALRACEGKFGFERSIRAAVQKRLLGDLPTKSPKVLFVNLDLEAMGGFFRRFCE